MIHIESEDSRGLPMWDMYEECGHWGLIYVGSRIRWLLVPVWGGPLFTTAGIT